MLAVDGVEKANSGHPGHADGARRHRVRDLDAAPPLRSDGPGLARSRSLRALVRPRVDAALLDAAPLGLRPPARRAQAASASGDRRRRAIPSPTSRRASRRPPGRSARASPTPSAWRRASRCSRRASTKRARLHGARLRHLLRRRHDGGHLRRSRRASPATSASTTSSSSTTTTRSPSTARPTSPSRRTSASATRPTAGPCSTSTATTTRRSARRSTSRGGRAGAPVAHRRAHAHRQRLAEAGQLQGARRAARRRTTSKATKQKARLAARADVLRARRGARALRRARRRTARRSTRSGARRSPSSRSTPASKAELCEQAHERSTSRRISSSSSARRRPPKDAATRAQSSVIEQRVAALVPSLIGGSADLDPSTKTHIEGSAALAKGEFEGRNVHFGIREHAMGAFVNGVAVERRVHPVRRDVPHLQRLHAPGDPPRGALAPAVDLRLHARQRVPRRRRADAPAGRALLGAAAHPEPRLRAALRRARVRRGLGARARAQARARRRSRSRGRSSPTSRALPGFDNRTMLRGAYMLADADGAPTHRDHRHRVRGRGRHRREEAPRRRGRERPRRVGALLDAVRAAGRGVPRRASSRRACSASPSRSA